MCNDNRRYDISAVNLLQQAAANIEAERRRQYRAEMAQELQGKLRERLALYRSLPVTNFDYVVGLANGLTVAALVIDELSPPVVCDSN